MSIPSYHNDVYDNGPAYLRANCTMVAALSEEAASYAEASGILGVANGKRMASAVVSAADFVLQGGTAPVVRELAFLGKIGGTGVALGDPTVIAFLDTVNGKVLAQLAEAGTATTAPGLLSTFPAMTIYQAGTPSTN